MPCSGSPEGHHCSIDNKKAEILLPTEELLISCDPCPAGYYCKRDTFQFPALEQRLTGAGTALQAVAPEKCPDGVKAFPDITLSWKLMTYCPAGNDRSGTGGTQRLTDLLSAGFFSFIICPAGYICDNVTHAALCPEGHYCSAGANASKPCSKASACPAGSSKDTSTQYDTLLGSLGAMIVCLFFLLELAAYANKALTTRRTARQMKLIAEYQGRRRKWKQSIKRTYALRAGTRSSGRRKKAGSSGGSSSGRGSRWKMAMDKVSKRQSGNVETSASLTRSGSLNAMTRAGSLNAMTRSNSLNAMMPPASLTRSSSLKQRSLSFVYGNVDGRRRSMPSSPEKEVLLDTEKAKGITFVRWVIRGLDFHIGKAHVLKDLHARLHEGQLVGLMGESGSGKSTLLNILGGRAGYGEISSNVPARTGSGSAGGGHPEVKCPVQLNGEPFDAQKVKELVGFVPQGHIVSKELTVYENLLYASQSRAEKTMSKQRRERLVESALDLLGLQACRNFVCDPSIGERLSGGQMRRIGIGIELVGDTPIMLLDEPTSALDAVNTRLVVAALKDLANRGVLVVASLHQPRESVFHMLDILLLLRQGKLAYGGSREDAEVFFSEMGYRNMQQMNPADYYIEVCFGMVPRTRTDGQTIQDDDSSTGSHDIQPDEVDDGPERKLAERWLLVAKWSQEQEARILKDVEKAAGLNAGLKAGRLHTLRKLLSAALLDVLPGNQLAQRSVGTSYGSALMGVVDAAMQQVSIASKTRFTKVVEYHHWLNKETAEQLNDGEGSRAPLEENSLDPGSSSAHEPNDTGAPAVEAPNSEPAALSEYLMHLRAARPQKKDMWDERYGNMLSRKLGVAVWFKASARAERRMAESQAHSPTTQLWQRLHRVAADVTSGTPGGAGRPRSSSARFVRGLRRSHSARDSHSQHSARESHSQHSPREPDNVQGVFRDRMSRTRRNRAESESALPPAGVVMVDPEQGYGRHRATSETNIEPQRTDAPTLSARGRATSDAAVDRSRSGRARPVSTSSMEGGTRATRGVSIDGRARADSRRVDFQSGFLAASQLSQLLASTRGGQADELSALPPTYADIVYEIEHWTMPVYEMPGWRQHFSVCLKRALKKLIRKRKTIVYQKMFALLILASIAGLVFSTLKDDGNLQPVLYMLANVLYATVIATGTIDVLGDRGERELLAHEAASGMRPSAEALARLLLDFFVLLPMAPMYSLPLVALGNNMKITAAQTIYLYSKVGWAASTIGYTMSLLVPANSTLVTAALTLLLFGFFSGILMGPPEAVKWLFWANRARLIHRDPRTRLDRMPPPCKCCLHAHPPRRWMRVC